MESGVGHLLDVLGSHFLGLAVGVGRQGVPPGCVARH